MNSELVEELFATMIEQTPTQRREFISSADYPIAVKKAVTRLVKAFDSKSQLLNDDFMSDIAEIDPDFFSAETFVNDRVLKSGDRIKSYTVESVIGEGGMSVVYRALQTEPIKRRVALKLIRPSMFSPQSVIRFFREQQALALVAHPNIATLYEVGSTPQGHPFAAMEYVNGLPITAFCEKYNMASRQRMILFTQVLGGLIHAHRHGIVHRDIKPDNILIGVRDRQPVAKLIDFGIAKINRQDLNNDPTMTQVGQILGSPRYMSPEQLENRPVDQRSDVYSAALVLFEILARSPYRKGDTTGKIMDHAKAPVPELLSCRINKYASKPGIQPFQNEPIDSLLKFVRRDLDWIMAKALAREPQHRYPTATAFLKDLCATLRNKTVSVGRPGPVARAKRFARANKTRIGVVAVVFALIFGTIGIYNWGNKSENELNNALNAKTVSAQQTAAANDLIMRLLASEMYELTTDQFDLALIPAYESQYHQVKTSGGPKSNEDKTVYGILAVLYAMSGDFDQADDLMEQVAGDQQKSELRLVREKICAEYAATAKEKLKLLVDKENSFERASQQMTLGRCYIVWNMLDDAKSLLLEAIVFFDSNEPGCYESLVARNTLVKIYEKAGDLDSRASLLVDTYELFKDNERLRASPRGAVAFSTMVDQLVEVDPVKYRSLQE